MTMPRAGRYLISGGSGAAVNIGTLYFLARYAGVWYLASSVIAFLISFLVSFTLQRAWTFEHRTADDLARHAAQYLFVAVANTLLNTGIVYGLVEYLSVWYVAAQIIAGAFVAFWSFFLYRRIFA